MNTVDHIPFLYAMIITILMIIFKYTADVR